MNNVCRTCLRAPSKLVPIQMDDGLVHKIERISSIQLSFNDYYPSSICEECLHNVNKFYCFQKVIINNDKELRERYDTVKKTNFICKPRTKEKAPEEEKGHHVIKEELYVHIVNEDNEDDNNYDIYDDDDDEDKLKVSKDLLDVINNIGTEENEEVDETTTKESKVECIKSIKRAISKLNAAKCDECNITFTSRLKLYNHKRTVHIAPGVCNICGMVVRADNLKRHVQMHSEGPATCEICHKVFKNSESLRGHMLIHKGLQFTCEICGKSSRVKSEHRRHLKTHTDPGSRKVMCTLCGKQVRDMKRHMQSHTGERPHTCTYCKRGFTSPYSLKIHTRQHTNERPFICEYCSVGFPQKVSLTAHLKSKHDAIFS